MPISTPIQIAVPFATSGLKNAIPAASNPVTGNAGYDAGFPATNMTPKEAGGIPPFGQDFNGIFFDITTAIQYLEAGMLFPYSSSFATAVGGYPLGALVTRTDGNGFWRNNVSGNTTNPETFGAGWSPEGDGITNITMAASNITLTALQAAKSIIVISGTITANIQLIFPAYQRQWLVVNNATGAFTVTCKTASGGGVAVASSGAQFIYGNGTNILPTATSPAATTTTAGISRLATNAEMATGTSTTAVPPVAAVMSLFSKRTFVANDFIRIPDVPGGLLIQWGIVAVPAYTDGSSFTGTWPTPYPTACFGVSLTSIGAVNILRQGSVSLSGFSGGTATRDQSGTSALSSAFFLSAGY